MISFPNAKINLGLHITGKREDGFHNISTLMLPTTLFDALEFVEAKKDSLTISGLEVPGEAMNNLVMKALYSVREEHKLPALEIHLHKNIPSGAGLGGGSSDASFMIKMLNAQYSLGMEIAEMQAIASSLGSDCSFFIQNKPQIATGRGDILKKIDFMLPGKYLYIFLPDFSVSTQSAYSGIEINKNPPFIENLIREELSNWRKSIFNDFEKKIFKEFPVMKELKESLYKSGASYVSMSGSGSALFAIYQNKPVFNRELESLIIHKQKL